jgi:hypothetical protein
VVIIQISRIVCDVNVIRCQKRFDDLTETVLAEHHHQLLPIWILCMYFMELNLFNAQIACELDLNKDDLQFMTEHLRARIDKKRAFNALW